jgi:alpha-tubulin suppressor-like RCC1 family protein
MPGQLKTLAGSGGRAIAPVSVHGLTAWEDETMKLRHLYLWGVIGAIIFLACPAGAAAPQKSVLAAGSAHTLAIQKDGTLWAWGWNDFGQLGLGPSNRLSPTRVPWFNAPHAVVIPLN